MMLQTGGGREGERVNSWSEFARNIDWMGLVLFLFSAAAALLCITLHELAHGFAAYRLGDTTARDAGRLTFNPLKHIDPVGLIMMVTVHMGWAKPVPIDMRRFRHPKRDMAVTALAGPAANFLLAYAALLAGSAVYRLAPMDTVSWVLVLLALLYIAVLSLGLGVFNLIPVPPLDGSKILLSFLPDRICYTVLRWERYIGLAMLLLIWLGVFDGPLTLLRSALMRGLCFLSGFPYELAAYYFF